jgi:hypothetical protein
MRASTSKDLSIFALFKEESCRLPRLLSTLEPGVAPELVASAESDDDLRADPSSCQPDARGERTMETLRPRNPSGGSLGGSSGPRPGRCSAPIGAIGRRLAETIGEPTRDLEESLGPHSNRETSKEYQIECHLERVDHRSCTHRRESRASTSDST